MKISFDSGSHSYLMEGRKVPSVTAILKNVGLSGSYRFNRSIHAFRGSTVHEACGLLDSGALEIADINVRLNPPWDTNAEYVKVASEIPGYCSGFLEAKRLLSFQGFVYECPMICTSEGWAGMFDMVAFTLATIHKRKTIWDLKSGTYPVMTVVQICGYEDLARRGVAVNSEHPGLKQLIEAVRSEPQLERAGLQLKKDGTFQSHFETNKGESYSLPKWMTVWRSALTLHRFVPNHEVVSEGEDGHPTRESRLSDLHWVAEAAKAQLTGKVYDNVMRAGENLWNIRSAYKLL